jgi:hypothetical protein
MRRPSWVTSGRTQSEHNVSAVPEKQTLARGRHVALGPIPDSLNTDLTIFYCFRSPSTEVAKRIASS